MNKISALEAYKASIIIEDVRTPHSLLHCLEFVQVILPRLA